MFNRMLEKNLIKMNIHKCNLFSVGLIFSFIYCGFLREEYIYIMDNNDIKDTVFMTIGNIIVSPIIFVLPILNIANFTRMVIMTQKINVKIAYFFSCLVIPISAVSFYNCNPYRPRTFLIINIVTSIIPIVISFSSLKCIKYWLIAILLQLLYLIWISLLFIGITV
jgi:hypothetical protein